VSVYFDTSAMDLAVDRDVRQRFEVALEGSLHPRDGI
jgi:hypothetical protein